MRLPEQRVLLVLDALEPPIRGRSHLERREAGQRDEQDHASAPHVRLVAVVRPPSQHLRRHVATRATLCAQQQRCSVFVLAESRQAKVGDLQLKISGQQQVLRLQVAVADALFVAVAHAGNQLLEVRAADC